MSLAYIVDWFTLYHFMLWAAIGAAAQLFWNPRLLHVVVLGVAIGLTWEISEISVEQWLNFREPPLNRWVTDPISDALGSTAGALLVRRRRRRTPQKG